MSSSAINPSCHAASSSSSVRHFEEPSEEVKEAITELFETVANKSVYGLFSMKGPLKELAEKVEKTHPLVSMRYVFSQKDLLSKLVEIKKSRQKWKQIENTLAHAIALSHWKRTLIPKLSSFAEEINLPYTPLDVAVQKQAKNPNVQSRKWEKVLDLIVEHAKTCLAE